MLEREHLRDALWCDYVCVEMEKTNGLFQIHPISPGSASFRQNSVEFLFAANDIKVKEMLQAILSG